MKGGKPILFCDFDGVLCYDRFWRSLPSHEYEKMQDALFRGNKEMVNDWMRGAYCAEEIVKIVSEKTGMPYERLWGVFIKDCECIFFDDSRSTCELFTKLGGTSYLVTKECNLPYHLGRIVEKNGI